jgi:hypothetical protein
VAGAQAWEIDAVLERMIDAYGGEENLQKLDRQIQYWDLLAVARNREGTEVRNILLPGRLQVELNYPDRREARSLDGDTAIVVFGDRHPSPATPPQRDAMRLQLMRLYSPLALQRRIAHIQLQSDGGHFALSLTENGLRADYLVNGDNWRIEKVIGTLEMGGRKMQFLTEYSEFEFVEGVLVHHAENKFAGQTNTARLKLRRIEFDGKPERDPPPEDRQVTRL